MTKRELNDLYFNWMYQLVCGHGYARRPYRKLLDRLHSIDFSYILKRDADRAEDGVALRYRFGYEHSYSDQLISSYLDGRHCSVLEMMVALSVRCEEHIMNNPDIGNRTGQWFWAMVGSMGLRSMDDGRYDDVLVDEVIFRFLNREYDFDGKGGLFTSSGRGDMRDIEIWYQMSFYLDDIDIV